MDVVIIGKGPAGWSCAMTARMRGLSAAVIAPQEDGGLLRGVERIDNYPGLPSVSGDEMLRIFREQALSLGAEEMTGLVASVTKTEQGFMLLVENQVIEAKSVVICIGAARPVLLPGEEELVGRGVSYCATCDGMFYRGKKVAMLSATEQGAEESRFLAGIAAELDYYQLKPHKTDRLPENAAAIGAKPKALRKENGKILVKTEGEEKEYDGVFIYRSSVALAQLMPGLETSGSAIVVDRQGRTNIPGVFAAGDCTGKPLQIGKAVGEGNVAALAAAEYIASLG